MARGIKGRHWVDWDCWALRRSLSSQISLRRSHLRSPLLMPIRWHHHPSSAGTTQFTKHQIHAPENSPSEVAGLLILSPGVTMDALVSSTICLLTWWSLLIIDSCGNFIPKVVNLKFMGGGLGDWGNSLNPFCQSTLRRMSRWRSNPTRVHEGGVWPSLPYPYICLSYHPVPYQTIPYHTTPYHNATACLFLHVVLTSCHPASVTASCYPLSYFSI